MVKEQLLRRVAPNIRWKVPLFLALSLAAIGQIACGGDSSPRDVEVETVRGFILEVNAKSFLELESLSLEDEGGTIWLFKSGGRTFPDFTPSHIREHMVTGQRVSVTFERDDDVLTVVDVAD